MTISSVEGDNWRIFSAIHNGEHLPFKALASPRYPIPKAWIGDTVTFDFEGAMIESTVIRVDIHDEYPPENAWYSYKVIDANHEKYFVTESSLV